MLNNSSVCVCVCVCVCAVSYTHLDVYKRQGRSGTWAFGCSFFVPLFCLRPIDTASVSYTHLDVYKRQTIVHRVKTCAEVNDSWFVFPSCFKTILLNILINNTYTKLKYFYLPVMRSEKLIFYKSLLFRAVAFKSKYLFAYKKCEYTLKMKISIPRCV